MLINRMNGRRMKQWGTYMSAKILLMAHCYSYMDMKKYMCFGTFWMTHPNCHAPNWSNLPDYYSFVFRGRGPIEWVDCVESTPHCTMNLHLRLRIKKGCRIFCGGADQNDTPHTHILTSWTHRSIGTSSHPRPLVSTSHVLLACHKRPINIPSKYQLLSHVGVVILIFRHAKNEELPNRHQESRWRVKRGCHPAQA